MKDDINPTEKPSALKRYLEKQAQPQLQKGSIENDSAWHDGTNRFEKLKGALLTLVQRIVVKTNRPREAKPEIQPYRQSAVKPSEQPNERPNERPSEQPNELPGTFGSRLVSYIFDICIIAMIMSGLGSFLRRILIFLPEFFAGNFDEILRFGVIFLYFGWFYAERASSPGKMLLNLEIYEASTGRKLGYWRTFFRETIGKFLSAVMLGFGFLIVLARGDRRALHDLIFDSRVVQKSK